MARRDVPIPLHRLEAFSDGVIAIVITLMILEIKIPTVADSATSVEIWKSWLDELPSLTAYLLSFATLGVLWVNHHQFFRQLKSIDRKLLWYNLHLLFWMCIVPIPTAFLGLHHLKPEATALYGFTMLMNTLAFALMRNYVRRHEYLLIDNLPAAIMKKMQKKILRTAAIYFISIFAGYISIYISIAIFVLILISYFMPQKIVIEAPVKEAGK